MMPPALSVRAADLNMPTAASLSSHSLPAEDPEELRRAAMAAAWNYGLTARPVHSGRKCPVLPGFVPRAVPQGVTGFVADGFHAEGAAAGRGAGADAAGSAAGEKELCPYRS